MRSATGRFDYLDGIRAVAIAAVLALHWFSWYVPLFHGGSIGVDVFFVLSGFIITTMLWRSPVTGSRAAAWVAFLRRRVSRLYPALLGLVVASAVLYAVVPWAPVGPVEVLQRGVIVLGQGSAMWAADQHGSLWLPGLQPFGQTWSLAVEWYFYALWPVAVLGARSRGWSARRLAGVSLGAALALYLLSLPLGAFWFYFGPSARSAELLVGAALALWSVDRVFTDSGHPARPRRHASAGAALVAIGGYALLGPDAHSPVYRYVGIPLAVLATVVLIHTGYSNAGAGSPDNMDGPVHRLLGHPWLAAVGRGSYSLYLWHIVPFLLLEDAPLPKPVSGLIAVTAATTVTVLSYRFLERPFLRARSDVLSPQRPRVQQAA
ncbi:MULTISPECIES: acyltransferase family protein [unclassified Nocardioides]|uniref:acyltransferase family protein n=1 Tax=unclassified Nocardioides TaxID=2615069 RepID=UPI0009F01B70|nr:MULTISPECIES: acyltransferase [unclassified Nocardioides]GAW49875.1 Lipopolysaccharide modification acyltransferase [Nocardioides sp. PD653-B2]GAW54631.1 Lipopolysaccharide modification acyltransferase [Nocardioides sp. PD653]